MSRVQHDDELTTILRVLSLAIGDHKPTDPKTDAPLEADEGFQSAEPHEEDDWWTEDEKYLDHVANEADSLNDFRAEYEPGE